MESHSWRDLAASHGVPSGGWDDIRLDGFTIRRLTKLVPRLRRLQELNPSAPTDKLVPVAAGQIIA